MVRFAHISRLLIVLGVLSLVVAPVAARGGLVVESSAMLENMDCCPPDKPMMLDCQKSCPLLALCMANCISALVVSESRVGRRVSVTTAWVTVGDNCVDALTLRPPAPPPRI